jgi:hypothetical protein
LRELVASSSPSAREHILERARGAARRAVGSVARQVAGDDPTPRSWRAMKEGRTAIATALLELATARGFIAGSR